MPVEIDVWLVKKAGTQNKWSVLAPGAEAHVGDRITWKAATDNIDRIERIVFKGPGPLFPNPFHETNPNIPNPDSGAKNMTENVRANAAEDRYYYKIFVKQGNRTHVSDDPPLDIVPGG